MPADSFPSKEDARSFGTSRLRSLVDMYDDAPASPEELEAWARDLLVEQFGTSAEAAQSVFAPGALSLLADHTHYSNGFALLMPMRQGVAVALRPAKDGSSRVVFEGENEATVYTWQTPSEVNDEPAWVRVLAQVIAVADSADTPVEGAVVSTMPSGCRDSYLAALAVATVRAVGAHDWAAMQPVVRRVLAACTERPFSIAFPLASAADNRADVFTLVDTATHEHLPVETAARDELVWVLLDPQAPAHDAAFHRCRRDEADEAIALLRSRVFEGIDSFRELEHQNLPRAIEAVPPRLAPVVRHLVTDNRRVQKMVAAMRRNDWQMVGALLLMAHASRRDEWNDTTREADAIVERVEALTVEGVYGACMTGRDGYVVLVGQAYALPLGLEPIMVAFEQQFGRALHALRL